MVGEDVPLCLAGNKCDLDKRVDPAEVEAFAKEHGAGLFWTSALANKNVDVCFLYLARAAIAVDKERRKKRALESDKAPDRLFIVDDKLAGKKKPDDSECCV